MYSHTFTSQHKNMLHILTLIYEYSSHQKAMQSIVYHDSFEEEGRMELQNNALLSV